MLEHAHRARSEIALSPSAQVIFIAHQVFPVLKRQYLIPWYEIKYIPPIRLYPLIVNEQCYAERRRKESGRQTEERKLKCGEVWVQETVFSKGYKGITKVRKQ